MTLHDLLGRHVPDLKTSHWADGWFVTRCVHCGREMIKLPEQPWRIRDKTD